MKNVVFIIYMYYWFVVVKSKVDVVIIVSMKFFIFKINMCLWDNIVSKCMVVIKFWIK